MLDFSHAVANDLPRHGARCGNEGAYRLLLGEREDVVVYICRECERVLCGRPLNHCDDWRAAASWLSRVVGEMWVGQRW